MGGGLARRERQVMGEAMQARLGMLLFRHTITLGYSTL